MNRYLITGGAGFIGSHFILSLAAKKPGVRIVNLDALTYAGNLENLSTLPIDANYRFVEGNITDSKLIETLLREEEINCIVHFAAESHVDRSITGPAAFIQTNIVGTFTLLEAAKKVWLDENAWDDTKCRFHHISTDEVYGSLTTEAPSFTENHPYQPNSPYSAAKASSDHLVRAYFHTFGLPTTISHCSNNYGANQHPEKFIPTVIAACRGQNPIPVYGDGANIRDWLHVDDHCEAIHRILADGKLGETYNIGGTEECSNIALVELICELFDEAHPEHAPHTNLIEFVADRKGHDWRYSINYQKAHETLGWQPTHPLRDSLRKLIFGD